MKLHYVTHESRRTRSGSKIWFRDKHTGRVRWTRPFYWITADSVGWWWSRGLNKWIHNSQWETYKDWRGECSSDYPEICKNHRKFRRLLKQWSVYLPEGMRFRLTGRLQGVEIIGTIRKPRRTQRGVRFSFVENHRSSK